MRDIGLIVSANLNEETIAAIHRTMADSDPAAKSLAFVGRLETWLDDDRKWLTLPGDLDDQPFFDMLERIAQISRAAAAAGGENLASAAVRADRAEHWLKARPAANMSGADEAIAMQIRGEALALAPALDDAVAHSVAGMVSSDWRDRLAELVATHWRLLERVGDHQETVGNILGAIGYGAFALGRSHEILGNPDKAIIAYEEAASTYRRLGDDDRTDEALTAASRIRLALSGDLGGTAIADLQMLIGSTLDPIARAHIAARLARQAAEANDLEGARRRAEVALLALVEAGYPDPAGESLAEIGAGWVDRVRRDQSPYFMTQIQEVSDLAVQALVHRCCAQLVDDPEAGRVTQRRFLAFGGLIQEIMGHAFDASREFREALRVYLPELPPVPARETTGFDEAIATNQRLNLLMEAVRAEPERMAELEPESASILDAVIASGPPNLIVQACVSRSILLIGLRRLDEADAVARLGEETLFAGRTEAEALAAGIDLYFFLELRWARLHAAAMERQFENVLALGRPAIRAIEAARYSIGNPTQQGTYLTRRTFFFECVIMAAFKLERWDIVVEVSDLLKARSAIHNRLAPALSGRVAELQQELLSITSALAAAASTEERAALRRQRNELWEVVAISRWQRSTANLPDLSVAAIQEVLEDNEAVVSWTWVGHGVLVAMAIDRTQVHAEGIVLTEAQQAEFDDYVAAIREGFRFSRTLGTQIEKIVEVALPSATHAFIASARRLKLVPHRGLHLVPFHAARVDGDYMIERAAISYIPNLASLLLPWRGASDGATISIGINRFDAPELNNLSGAESEAQDIAATWASRGSAATCLIGPDATVQAFNALPFATCRCLHLATHGSSVYADDTGGDPFESRLYLTDGAVDALAISQLTLPAEAVVMSACHSGQRAMSLPGLSELPGDDLFGLQAAWFQAGAHSVVGSLWPLDDKAATFLMPILHRQLAAGIAPDIALQTALRDYLRTPGMKRDVFFWASIFVSSMGRRIN